MNKTRKLFALVLTVCLLLAVMTACQSSATTSQSPSETSAGTSAATSAGTTAEHKIKIGITSQTMQVQVYQVSKMAAEAKAKELGVEVVWQSCELKPNVQMNQVEDFISQGVDVLIIEPAESNSAVEMVKLAKAKNIPVINMEALIAGIDTDLRIVADSYLVGQTQVDEFIKEWGTEKAANVVIASGTKGDEVAEEITRGNLDAIKKYPNLKVVVHQYHADWDRLLALNTMENALAKYNKDIQVVFANNDNMALGCRKAAENAGVRDNIVFWGGDFDTEPAELLLAGVTNYRSIDKGPYVEGERLVEAAVALAKGEKPTSDKVVNNVPIWYVPISVVNNDTIKEMCKVRYPELLK